ncbi:MAG: magnesium-translocating P-type ATPase [Candidatus Pacebacteria bacterium]|nr:magnesium-translocating P-type ATPase [Candidatus Paceibacterota bacterium]
MNKHVTSHTTVEQDSIASTIPRGYHALSSLEVTQLLRDHGENIIFHTQSERPLLTFLKKFNSPLLILLMGAAAVSLYVGQYVSGGIIIVMVFLSAVLDFVNSYRSERVAEALAKKIVTSAQVVRDGVRKSIPLHMIVPGDMVILSAGSVIPADGVLIRGDDVFTNQSALTGESFPVCKEPFKGSPTEALLAELRPGDVYALFMGTSVVTGFGMMLVVHTGARAEFGRIASRLAVAPVDTAFDHGIRSFSFFIMRIALFMVVAVFVVNAIKGGVGLLDSLLFAIAIAVGLTPELLPVVMTVTLSRGSLLMAKKHVVVRHLPAIQNLGAMTVLATDKTGTLTEDHITLMRSVDPWGEDSDGVFEAAYVSSAFRTARSSPLDDAIRDHRTLDLSPYRKVDEIPFDFSRKRGSVVYDKDGGRILVSKGAPEDMVPACTSVRDRWGERPLDEGARKAAIEQYEKLSREGFRVLAVADRHLPMDSDHEYATSVEEDLILLGFVAFYDPPKPTAADAILRLATLAVEVKIISGDSELLTERVCREIGLPIKGMMTGVEVARMNDHELAHVVQGVTIFARVTPEEKERVVRALRTAGETVGYLGDGINDAPALKAADVGISVNNAVDVAKETADIILLRKSLDVLEDGVREGRKTFENTMKYVRMGFSSNFGNMTSMMAASAFLPFLPMLPAQILLNNFLYDLSQTALPTDHVDEEAIRRPISWDIGAVRRYMLTFGLVSSVFDMLTFVMLYKVFGMVDGAFQTGWFIESIATQILVVYVIRTGGLPFVRSKPSRALVLSTTAIVVIALAIPYLPLVMSVGFVPLPLHTILAITGITLAYLVVAELAKRFYARHEQRRLVH